MYLGKINLAKSSSSPNTNSTYGLQCSLTFSLSNTLVKAPSVAAKSSESPHLITATVLSLCSAAVSAHL